MIEQVRSVLSQTAMIPPHIATLPEDANLPEAGLTSFASVQMMLALEEHFDIEFPETMLNRRTFATLGNVSTAVAELTRKAA
ncbi:acyl carrier protein [Pararhizobium mangrovi]|uniref:Acyl carrier protein n=1 Tax=Pararhizobium mangrovi TaxID=2590452 RepID=A0A506UHL0_9HYPH|nr:acyl carrier protein [Pararhizobium mangrovi]TPW32804.1 acyl carrier protein [Pararhizobium mangrovi]